MKPAADNTVCALCTPPGPSGLAVIRVSGPETFRLLDRMFKGPKPSRQKPNTIRLGWATDSKGKAIDQVMLSVFHSPHSYTGEHLAEISCHGSPLVVDVILNRLRELGCSAAGPGEFTRRAVLAGKLTLSQAEAVLDLINAKSEAALNEAIGRYQGGISRLMSGLREELLEILARTEYHLGFDETDDPWPAGIKTRIRRFGRRLDRAVARAEHSRRHHEATSIAIVGRPNVGKSSLFNRLLGENRTLVTPLPGTTRDRVEVTTIVGSALVLLSDTGGLTRSGGLVSRLAALETKKALDDADMVLLVFDGSEPARPLDRVALDAAASSNAICIINKSDLSRRFRPESLNGRSTSPLDARPWIPVSALTGANISRLKTLISRSCRRRQGGGALHLNALTECRAAVSRSLAAFNAETRAIEIRTGLDALGQLDAPCANRQVIDRVFAHFCVGK